MKVNENNDYVCEKCNTVLIRNPKWDAYYCENCNEWAESKCDDPKCEYCVDRPEKPL